MEGDYLIQIMAWNRKASSLQAVVKKGFIIPSHLALQGQIQFIYQKEHAVSIRCSRDVNSFGFEGFGGGRKMGQRFDLREGKAGL